MKILFSSLLCLIHIAVLSQKNINFYLAAKLNDSTTAESQLHLFVNGEVEKIKQFTLNHQGKFKYQAGNYSAILLPAKHVREFADQAFVKGIHYEAYQPVALNDTMRVRNNVDSAHAGYSPLALPYTGSGVISAIIDTGVDFLHPDLQDIDGKTRILAIWDQTAPFDINRTPPYGYGQVWDSTDINAGSCTQVDPSGYGGHGTTVVGTSSGNGLATGNHKGVAPEANIVVVKNDMANVNWLATISDAVDWIFHLADSLNMPASINISLGTYLGSHDGRDPAAHYIDSLIRAKDGRLVVAAAGNSGNYSVYGKYHLETIVSSDTSFTWFNYNPSSVFGYGSVYFEVFSDTNDFNGVDFAVGADAVSPTYSFRGRTDFFDAVSTLNTTVTDTIINNGNRIAIVDFYTELMDDVYITSVHLREPDSSQYKFRFMTTGNGKFDVWANTWLGISHMDNSSEIPTVAQYPAMAFYSAPDSAKVVVSSFQCLSSVATVANYNNKSSYIDYLGNTQTFAFTTGAISINSSRGPTRDNRLKPDIAASGDPTLSCSPLAVLAYQQANEPHKVDQDGMHSRNGGTSIASPVVSGVGVLLLEKCPSLNWQDFISTIQTTAKQDNFTATAPNTTWGAGKIDAFRALVATNFAPPIISDSIFCPNDSAIVSTSNYNSYWWSTNETTQSITADSSATYYLAVIDNKGCKSDTSSIIINISSPLSPLIDGVINSTPNDTAWTLTSGYTVNWYAENGSGADVFIASGDTIVFDPLNYLWLNHVTVYFILTDGNGCEFYSDSLYYFYPGVEELQETTSVTVFPNPNQTSFQIIANENLEKIAIVDMQGRAVLQEKFSGATLNASVEHRLSKGVYLLEVYTTKGYSVKRLVIN